MTWKEIKGIRIDWSEVRINPIEIYFHCSKTFQIFFIGNCQISADVGSMTENL